MQDLVNLLQKLNLNQREAKVYLFCLENGPATIADLSKHLKKDRTIIYRLVDKLVDQKILAKEIKQFGPKISATPPRKLIELIKREERKWKKIELLFTQHLPQFQGMQNSPSLLKPKVYFYEGIEEVKQSWLEHLDMIGPNKVLHSFGGTTLDLIGRYWPEFDQEYVKIREEKEILLKLMANIEINKRVFKNYFNSPYWEIRHSKIASSLKLDVQFGAEAIHFSLFDPNPSALILVNKQLANFFQILFDNLWHQAKELNPN